MDFQKFKVSFSEIKKYKNQGFDSNSSPQTHQLFNHIGFKCQTKNLGRSTVLRETLKISSKKRFLAILELIYSEFMKLIVTNLRTYFVVN
jgi:hypothetical protein